MVSNRHQQALSGLADAEQDPAEIKESGLILQNQSL